MKNKEEILAYENKKRQVKKLNAWYKENLPHTQVGKFFAKRFEIEMPDGQQIFVNKTFYKECISHYVNDEFYLERLSFAQKAHLILPKSKFLRQENANDHENTTFDVYQFDDENFIVELKVKRNQDGLFLYYMRIYKK